MSSEVMMAFLPFWENQQGNCCSVLKSHAAVFHFPLQFDSVPSTYLARVQFLGLCSPVTSLSSALLLLTRAEEVPFFVLQTPKSSGLPFGSSCIFDLITITGMAKATWATHTASFLQNLVLLPVLLSLICLDPWAFVEQIGFPSVLCHEFISGCSILSTERWSPLSFATSSLQEVISAHTGHWRTLLGVRRLHAQASWLFSLVESMSSKKGEDPALAPVPMGWCVCLWWKGDMTGQPSQPSWNVMCLWRLSSKLLVIPILRTTGDLRGLWRAFESGSACSGHGDRETQSEMVLATVTGFLEEAKGLKIEKGFVFLCSPLDKLSKISYDAFALELIFWPMDGWFGT